MNDANLFVEKNTLAMTTFLEKMATKPSESLPKMIYEVEDPQVLWSMHTIHQYLTKSLVDIGNDVRANNYSNFSFPMEKEESGASNIRSMLTEDPEPVEVVEEMERVLTKVGEIADTSRSKQRRPSTKGFF